MGEHLKSGNELTEAATHNNSVVPERRKSSVTAIGQAVVREGSLSGLDYDNTKYNNIREFANARASGSALSPNDSVVPEGRKSSVASIGQAVVREGSLSGLDYDNTKYNNIKEFANARASISALSPNDSVVPERRKSSVAIVGEKVLREGSLHGLEYDNTKYNNIKEFANARASVSGPSDSAPHTSST